MVSVVVYQTWRVGIQKRGLIFAVWNVNHDGLRPSGWCLCLKATPAKSSFGMVKGEFWILRRHLLPTHKIEELNRSAYLGAPA